MVEATKDELAPISVYDVVDLANDEAIIEMMTGQAIQDYVYSFKQGGKVVEGLTLAGINEAANRKGGIEVDEPHYEEREHSWLVIVKATDTLTGSSRYGAFEQLKMASNRPDPFAFTKAIHKAQRNAIKQLLPVGVIKDVLNFYMNRKTESNQSQVALPAESGHSPVENARKAAFAIAGKLEARFEEQGITKFDFWDYVKRRYVVESRKDMTESQWTQLSAELQAAESSPELFRQMLNRIHQLDAATKPSEIPDETANGLTTPLRSPDTTVGPKAPEELPF